eukprot:gene19193-25039_t
MIDIAISSSFATPVEVRFQWNGHANNSIELVGEFNGWKPETCLPDRETGKRYLIKALCSGRLICK